ncbi:MAG: type II secretion system F family protein [Candidatus Eremiobacteraeota bacterium]|nr:type II secretion system F family protein [Candidatus Eremiobacteraeota bacterium]MCL5056124.1 type II secretion system F family protein [Bacillota bacterium]
MPTYVYEAVNDEGRTVRGILEAKTRLQALEALKQYRYQIKKIQEQTKLLLFLHKLQKVNQDSIAIFTRQFAAMIKAGLPIMRCLDLLSRKGDNPRLEDVILLVREHVKAGNSLSQALARYPDVFNPVYLELIKAGELSGDMGDILERMANYLEKDAFIRKRLRSALTYPIVVFSFCVLIAFLLVIYIFPKFIGLFRGFHVPTPLPTQILMFTVNLAKNPFFILITIGILSVLAFLFSQYLRTAVGRRHYHQWLLFMPILGDLNKKVAASRFCRTLSTLIVAGVPLMQSLDIVGRVTGNEVLNEAVDQAKQAVKYGSTISAPLEESKIFPSLAVSMLQVGEQTGELPKMLKKVADFYDAEIELTLIRFTKLLEPILIAAMGLIVGFVVISIFLPIYSLIGHFSMNGGG